MSEPKIIQPELIREPRAVPWLGIDSQECRGPCGVFATKVNGLANYRNQLESGKVPPSKAIPKIK